MMHVGVRRRRFVPAGWLTALGLLFFLPNLAAQKTVSPDEVVVAIDGEEYTAGELEQIKKSLPGPFRKNVEGMDNATFIKVYAELVAFAKKAEEEGIPEKEPYRTQLEFNRLNYLAKVYLNELNLSLKPTEKDFQEYYEQYSSSFEQRRVSAIFIDYVLNPERAPLKDGQKQLSEEEARAKAEKLVAELRAGADFAALAKEHSDDPTSAEKGGDLGFYQHDARVPQPLKDAIFSLEPGQISDPQQHGGRFYILKVTETNSRPLDEVRGQIASAVQSAKLTKKIEEIRDTIDIEYRNEAYIKKQRQLEEENLLLFKEFDIPPPKKKSAE